MCQFDWGGRLLKSNEGAQWQIQKDFYLFWSVMVYSLPDCKI